MSDVIVDTNLMLAELLIAIVIGMVMIIAVQYFAAPTSFRLFWAKLTGTKNMYRKIYPGSRREVLKKTKKASPDDLFITENDGLLSMASGKAKIVMIDGAMKTEIGRSTIDGINIYTGIIGEDLVPVDPIKAAAGTNMLLEAKKQPLLSQIRGDKKIADLLTADFNELEKKARRYNPLSFGEGLSKAELIAKKSQAVNDLVAEVLTVRSNMAVKSYPVDYVTACNMVQSPIIPGLVEIIDLKLQKRNEDKKDTKDKLREFAIAGAIVIGAIAVSIYVLKSVVGI
jgi:hypothetical protein